MKTRHQNGKLSNGIWILGQLSHDPSETSYHILAMNLSKYEVRPLIQHHASTRAHTHTHTN